MKTIALKIIIVPVLLLWNPTMVSGQSFPGGGYQGGKYGSGGIENISGIPNLSSDLADSDLTAFPNPFATQSTVRFSVILSGKVEIAVFDINNRRVKTLISPVYLPPGNYSVIWDGTGNRGNPVAKGVYYYRMIKSNRITTKKILFTGNAPE